MTEHDAESFSLSQNPVIDPYYALLQAQQLIKDVFKSHYNFDTFDPIPFQKEVENETRSNSTTPKKIKSARVINSQVNQSEIIITMAKMILQFFKTTQNQEVLNAICKRSENH